MHFNLYATYWSLFFVTIISSSFLFFVVATENAKYVAATSKETAAVDDAAENDAPPAAAAASNVAPAAAPHEEVLPNYKKVKKLHSNTEADDGHRKRSTGEDYFASELDATGESLPAAGMTANEVDKNFEGDEIGENGGIVDADATRNSTVSELEPFEDLALASQVEAPATTNEELRDDLKLDDINDRLPDITEIPTVSTVHTITEIPLDILEPTLHGVDSLIIDGSAESALEARINRTLELLIGNSEEKQKDEQIIKINDSGGDSKAAEQPQAKLATEIPVDANENIPQENVGDAAATTASITSTDSTINKTQQEQQQQQQQPVESQPPTPAATEEVPIPVFSEWAQKQMEAAEKQQQLEQDNVNTSTQKKNNNNNNTNGGNKLPQLKLRAKNYASPDCGAKIIASNADASNTGAVLSSSKDEYMLTPCTQRVWFVVELCEAIQAQKIDLANFELFSSSPRNFSVAVSNRFPTRDWSNVGRFIAEDKRTVQSFDLHPHLFGKFVRVDIHSHYSKEHFCPVSLFRVFGTSEFEAFETENHPNDDLDDFDDEFNLEQAHVKSAENNLFKSASDAVLSIVKKAAEVLVKPVINANATHKNLTQDSDCQTLAFGQFSCAECNSALAERINVLLSCKYKQLSNLLRIEQLHAELLNTPICAKSYGIEIQVNPSDSCSLMPKNTSKKQSYFLNILPAEYVGALCQVIAENISITSSLSTPLLRTKDKNDDAEVALNLTIDKKLNEADFRSIENIKENNSHRLIKAVEEDKPVIEKDTTTSRSTKTITNTESVVHEGEQLARSSQIDSAEASTTAATAAPTESTEHGQQANAEVVAEDINIFNLNVDGDLEETQKNLDIQASPSFEGSADYSGSATAIPITSTETQLPPPVLQRSSDEKITVTSTEDPSSWDSIDNLLTSTTAAPGIAAENNANQATNAAGGGGTPGVIVNGINMQQKIPNGPHSESIFIRLSNRIKALERNMSLSGQYLEELSRRYKKQVEELQQTLSQQTLNVRLLEEQNRRHSEFQQLLSQRNVQLKDELDDLTLQTHACIVVIIFVGAFVFLVLMVGILLIRSMRRETKELQAYGQGKRKSAVSANASNANAIQRKLNRRKSYEDFSDHQHVLSNCNTAEKQRRPSEEAMLILKDCAGDISDNCLNQTCNEHVGDTKQDSNAQRQRKVSVCYVSNSNMNGIGSVAVGKVMNVKRRNDKHSWPNSEQSQKLARQHLEELNATEQYDKFAEKDLLGRQQNVRLRTTNQLTNGGNKTTTNNESTNNAPKGKSSKKKTQNAIKRQVSAPNNMSEYSSLPTTAHATHTRVHSLDRDDVAQILKNNHHSSDYDESLMLDEDDLDNFLPVADLVYNEFMPEGPSGYQISTPTDAAKVVKSDKKKSRRLSSPAFFKSPFSKSLKSKSPSISTSPPPVHESTSWEWYRLKKSDSHKRSVVTNSNTSSEAGKHNFLRPSISSGFPQRSSPAVSIDSTSLSEINFPTNSNENSFRILEEAILGNTTTTLTTNGNGNGNGSSSGGSSSVRSSSTTSSKKKKSRSFNKIFRKVF